MPMYVNIAVLKETLPHERRFAMVPAVAARLQKLGGRLHMQPGAGASINLADADFPDAVFIEDVKALVAGADVVLAIQPPSPDVIDAMQENAILICFVYENDQPELIKHLLARNITCFAMERIPRITRAQAMDALSSQSALAGYLSIMLGATYLKRILPKITTAAGAIGPAKVLVMGLGVAGLEAVATAHRMGAVVEGYDVRPETAEQVASLGAAFVATGVNAAGKGGYARELTAAEKTKVADTLTKHIQEADLIITTAAIPGRKSPKLISALQVKSMKSGSVIIDLSAEGGGNCEESGGGCQCPLRQKPVQPAIPVPEGQHHHHRLVRRSHRQNCADARGQNGKPTGQSGII
jgi:NAD(P) transhydrogenase subunit alpha